jgi:hypothetical protein
MNFREERGYPLSLYDHETWTVVYDSSVYNSVINLDMDITFKDPKDINNYYIIILFQKYELSNGHSLYSPFYYYSDDMVYRTGNDTNFLEDIDNKYLKSTLFNDDLFDGKEYKLKIKTNNYYSNITIGENPDDPGKEVIVEYNWKENGYEKIYGPEVISMAIHVELQSLSYSHYMYLKTLGASRDMDGFMEFFAEPVQIYSNIKGGIGILGSYSNSIYTIPLK